MTVPENRPEVVDAIFTALSKMDPAALDGLQSLGVTPEELRAGQGLFATSLSASRGQREQLLEFYNVLSSAGYNAQKHSEWFEIFDLLSDEDVDRVRGLYTSMPEEARVEFDSRYGRPQL